jgi:tetratricopeptide (TPR) repeat protein
MSREKKKADRRKVELPRAASAEGAAGDFADRVKRSAARGEASGLRGEPIYQELLQHFQNAEWDQCLSDIERLLQIHPDDEELGAFKHDVEIRSELERTSQQQQQVDDRLRRRRLWRQVPIAVLSVLIVAGLAYWFVSSYQAEQTREQLSAQATATAQALAARMTMADTLMRAGKAEEALALYGEIQQADPAYKGVGQDMQKAQQAITVEDLYQQAKRALDNGDNVQSLKLLEQVDKLQPQYKDTAQLIAGIQRDQKIAALVAAIQAAGANGGSAAVIKDYEAIQAIDPSFEMPELDETLFSSYRDLILKISENPNPTLDQIQTAATYYRNAMALFPQSIEHARDKAELQDIAINLLASQDYLQGLALLESSNYSIQGLQQTNLVLQRAREKAPQSLAVDAEIQKVQTFIDAYDALVHGAWDKAITGFDSIYKRDPSFAAGRVRVFLYEAYTARGDLFLANGDFGAAFKDYQDAEKVAFIDDADVLRIFQIEVRVASIFRRMGQYEQSAEYFHFAFQKVNYSARLTKPEQKDLLQALQEADSVYNAGDKLKAGALYEATLDQTQQLYVLDKVAAMQGDTLPNLAFENGTSVWSMRNANDLGDRLILARSQELLVPVLSPVGKPISP